MMRSAPAGPSDFSSNSGEPFRTAETLEAVTLTGGRPVAFGLCEKWMADQTRQPDRWIVVDDCKEPTTVTQGQTVIRPEPFWRPGDRTINRNLQAALEEVTGDIIVIIEDDDHYHPDWIQTVWDHFQDTPDMIVGEGLTRYYHLMVNGWKQNSNTLHASLCATAFRAELVGTVMELLRDLPPQNPFLDGPIWQKVGHFGTVWTTHLVTGIKGIPGRDGAGQGHRTEQWPTYDNKKQGVLESWIGPEAVKLYRQSVIPPPSEGTPPNMRP
jgi:glycosyltransferase involved in cell wall biosynthesis